MGPVTQPETTRRIDRSPDARAPTNQRANQETATIPNLSGKEPYLFSTKCLHEGVCSRANLVLLIVGVRYKVATVQATPPASFYHIVGEYRTLPEHLLLLISTLTRCILQRFRLSDRQS